jgi:hypothetical protein
MKGLFAAFVLGAVAGGIGALAAARQLRTETVQARLNEAQTQIASMSGLLGETRTVLDETRSQLRGAWTAAAGRTPAAPDSPAEAEAPEAVAPERTTV